RHVDRCGLGGSGVAGQGKRTAGGDEQEHPTRGERQSELVDHATASPRVRPCSSLAAASSMYPKAVSTVSSCAGSSCAKMALTTSLRYWMSSRTSSAPLAVGRT